MGKRSLRRNDTTCQIHFQDFLCEEVSAGVEHDAAVRDPGRVVDVRRVDLVLEKLFRQRLKKVTMVSTESKLNGDLSFCHNFPKSSQLRQLLLHLLERDCRHLAVTFSLEELKIVSFVKSFHFNAVKRPSLR